MSEKPKAAPKATPAQVKTFTTGVDKAQADFNKSLADAKSTLAQANKQGNKFVADSARNLINQLNTVVKPALAILQKAENPNAGFKGSVTGINQALAGGAPGSGPSGAVLGIGGAPGGKGAYSLEQILAFMNANNGSFPPDLNTIASGITAADLTNLVNQYESGATTVNTGLTNTGTTPTTKPGPTLAKDAFVSTFRLIVGDSEGSKSYVGELYDYVSKYYKSGFTIPEAINLSLRDAKTSGVMPAFTDRFKAIFALEDLKRQGKVVDVPTVAEYVKSEQALGEVLNRAGLGDLATETTLANVFSTGKSVAETTSIINDVFLAIDNAPAAWKANVAKVIPFADRTSLARAVLLGAEGAQALQKTVAKAGVLTAAEQQGLTLSSAQQSELVASGESFGTSLGKFAQTRGILDTAQKLKSMEMGIAPKDAYTQEQAMAATFNQSYDELQNLAKLSEREQNRFRGSAGIIGSRGLASQARGAGLI
jgi:hypothetical protein